MNIPPPTSAIQPPQRRLSWGKRGAGSLLRTLRGTALARAFAMAVVGVAVPPTQAQTQDPQGRVQVLQVQQALARGAVAWDLRSTGAVLPGAVRIAPQALRAWRDQDDIEALSQAVSAAGLNLSAEVVLVADDDSTAQAVAERLRPLARGRLAWLAGGAAAWQAAGLPLDAVPSLRLPVPQRLSAAAPALAGTARAVAPADAARRTTVTLGPGLPVMAATASVLPLLR